MNLPVAARNRANARKGNVTEHQVARLMAAMGFLHVEPIERAWSVKWQDGKIRGAIPRAKVSGDITAVCPGGAGRAVHVEVKAPKQPRLSIADFRGHQIQIMDEKAASGVLVLVAWVHLPHGVALLPWPVAKLAPRRPISWQEAQQQRITEVPTA
jgi:hypothetical protein